MSESPARKILVVEDNDFVRMQIVRFLTDGGYQCIEAATADQGLEQATDSVPVVIVDVRMEPADGFEFISALRARGQVNTVVILVTGDQNPDILEKAARFNVATILMKPVQKDRLLSMVSRAIAMKERMG